MSSDSLWKEEDDAINAQYAFLIEDVDDMGTDIEKFEKRLAESSPTRTSLDKELVKKFMGYILNYGDLATLTTALKYVDLKHVPDYFSYYIHISWEGIECRSRFKAIVDSGVSINNPVLCDGKNTLLSMTTLGRNSLKYVKDLLDLGANPMLLNEYGMTILDIFECALKRGSTFFNKPEDIEAYYTELLKRYHSAPERTYHQLGGVYFPSQLPTSFTEGVVDVDLPCTKIFNTIPGKNIRIKSVGGTLMTIPRIDFEVSAEAETTVPIGIVEPTQIKFTKFVHKYADIPLLNVDREILPLGVELKLPERGPGHTIYVVSYRTALYALDRDDLIVPGQLSEDGLYFKNFLYIRGGSRNDSIDTR